MAKPTSIEGALQRYLEEAGPLQYLGAQVLLTGAATGNFTLPAGTNLVHLQLESTEDAHVQINAIATTSSFRRLASQEYWLGPFAPGNLTQLAAIRVSAGVNIYAEYYKVE
jgi:hypothetical protein